MTSAGHLACNLARLYVNSLRAQITPFRIGPGKFPILLALRDCEGFTQSALLAMLDIEPAMLTNTLSRMERDRLIGRRTHLTDARARMVHLTDRG